MSGQIRRLKIEEHGDPCKGKLKPKIRLCGNWLERAGFSPGNHISVNCVTHGVIELRCQHLNEAEMRHMPQQNPP